MGEPRIIVADRLRQRVDDRWLDAVRQMARFRDVREAAPAVRDFLVLGERVGDQREDAQVFAEGLC